MENNSRSNTYIIRNDQYLIMTFPSMDKSLGYYDSSTGSFTAPVDGRYQFDLHLATGYDGDYNHLYTIDIQVDDRTMEKFQSFRSSYSNYASMDRNADSNYYTTEIELKERQVLRLYVSYSSHSYESSGGCINTFDGSSVGCSYLQGKLIQRY